MEAILLIRLERHDSDCAVSLQSHSARGRLESVLAGLHCWADVQDVSRASPPASRGEDAEPEEVEVFRCVGVGADGEPASGSDGTAGKFGTEIKANGVSIDLKRAGVFRRSAEHDVPVGIIGWTFADLAAGGVREAVDVLV